MMISYNTQTAQPAARQAIVSEVRKWVLPVVTFVLVLVNQYLIPFDGGVATAIAASLIVLAGIPHGTLDVEIAASRVGRQKAGDKIKIISAYIAGAAGMAVLWAVSPPVSLILFLVLSIAHFGADWRTEGDGFFALTIGWALIAMPALSHPEAVASLFEILTGDRSGGTIAAILACTAVPALCGSLIFAAKAVKNEDQLNGFNVLACLVAAALLPPLVGFAVFFCGLHSPRHLAEAIHQSGSMPRGQKALRGVAVMALSLGIGAVLFGSFEPVSIDSGIVRTAFTLISILTVPHFILEQLSNRLSAEPTANSALQKQQCD
jgi:beta-carotene 15,15'-dioxygenase